MTVSSSSPNLKTLVVVKEGWKSEAKGHNRKDREPLVSSWWCQQRNRKMQTAFPPKLDWLRAFCEYSGGWIHAIRA